MSLPIGRRAAALLLGALLAAPAAGCAGALHRQPSVTDLPEGREVVLPCRFVEDIIVVDVHVDGAGPFPFVLDTGCSAVLVGPRVADALPGRTRPAAGAGARAPDGRPLMVERAMEGLRIRAGDAVFHEVGALVIDLAPVEATTGLRLDGVLGFPAFVQGLLVLDYPSREVRFSRGALPPADGEGVLPLTGGYSPLLDVRIGARRHRVLVDSGFSGALYLPEFPPAEDLVAAPVPWFPSTNLAGDTGPTLLARLASPLLLGSHRVEGANVMRSGSGSLLGAGILRHFEVALDARNGRIRFSRAAEGPVRFGPRRGVGLRARMADGACVVAAVLPGSPADAAGIRPGARVISLAGLRPAATPLADIEERLWEAEVVEVVLDEATGPRTVTLTAVVLVP